MPLVHAERVRESSATTGTGTYSLAGAPSADFQTFVAGVGNGNTCLYAAFESGVGWETGVGTVASGSPDTLARTQILASSNGGAAVNWAAGTRTLICTPLAAKFRGWDELFTMGVAPPDSPKAGDRWLDAASGIVYTYVTDEGQSVWAEFGGMRIFNYG
jgi:hypothetical protein